MTATGRHRSPRREPTANSDAEAAKKAIGQLRSRASDLDFSIRLRDTLAALCGGDKERVGAALWELFRQGEDVLDHAAFAEFMAHAPQGTFDAGDLYAYFGRLAGRKPRWIGNEVGGGDSRLDGWTVSFEKMVRKLVDMGVLASDWKRIGEPIRDKLALALARRGALRGEDLPAGALEKAVRAYLSVFTSSGQEIVFEGIEGVWPRDPWDRAIVLAASSPDVREVQRHASTLESSFATATDAQMALILPKMRAFDRGWVVGAYRQRAAGLEDHLSAQAEAALGRVKQHKYLMHESVPFLVHAERTIARDGTLDERFDPVIVELIGTETSDALRGILRSLPQTRRERLLLRAMEKKNTVDWDALAWFPSPALARHCVEACVGRRQGRVHAYHALSHMGAVGAAVVCEFLAQRRVKKKSIEPARLSELMLSFNHAQLPAVVDECLRLLHHPTDYIRRAAHDRLYLQALDDMLERALDALLGSNEPELERLAATYLVRWSHDERARRLAASRRDRAHDALARARLGWAAALEPPLEALCHRMSELPEEVTSRVESTLEKHKDEAVVAPEALRPSLQGLDGLAAFVKWHLRRRSEDEDGEVDGHLIMACWLALAPEPGALYAAVRWFTQPYVQSHSYASFARYRLFDASPELVSAHVAMLNAGVLEEGDELAAIELAATRAPELVLARLETAAMNESPLLRKAATEGLVIAGYRASDIVIRLLSQRSARAHEVAANVLQRAPLPGAVAPLSAVIETRPAAALIKKLEAALDACRAAAERTSAGAPPRTARALAAQPTAIALEGAVTDLALSATLVLAASSSGVQLAQRPVKKAKKGARGCRALLFDRAGVAHPFVALAPDERCFAIGTDTAEVFRIEGDKVSSGVALAHDDGLHSILALPGGRLLTLCAAHNAYTPLTLFSTSGRQIAVHDRDDPLFAVLLPARGRYLVASSSGRVAIRDIKTGAILARVRAPRRDDEMAIGALAAFDGGRAAALLLPEEGALEFYDLPKKKRTAVVEKRAAGVKHVCGVAVTPWLFLATDTSVQAWTREGHLFREHALGSPLVALVATPAGVALVERRDVQIWSPDTNAVVARWSSETDLTAAAAVDDCLCVGDDGGKVSLLTTG